MKIRRDMPAGRWKEAFPLGNGQIGAMVYGGIKEERIDLSELTFFSGCKCDANNRAEAAKAFYKMRAEALAGDFEAMTETSAQVVGVRNNYGTNLPVGWLMIKTGQDEKAASSYSRELDLGCGIVKERYRYQEVEHRRSCYTSHEYKVMVYRMYADESCLNADISLTSFREGETAAYREREAFFKYQALETLHSDGKTGTELYGAFTVQTDGQLETDTGGFHVKGASEILLYLTMITEFDQAFGMEEVKRRLNCAARAGYEQITALHRQDMESLYERSTLYIAGTDKQIDELPVMYQMGRYLLYSSSREDSLLPAHLQGVWNDNVACRIGWTCDMHLDINTQMNYWPAETTNLPETARPLIRWVQEELVPNGHKTAETTYGCPGWAAELVSNAWGYAAPYWAEPIAPCPACGIWIATHLWEHYLYSRDQNFLRAEVYPVIAEAVRFFEAYIFEDENGYYTSGPAISPENSYVKDGKIYYHSIGSTFEILMIRELFMIFENICGILKIEDELLWQVRAKAPKLLPYRILADGTLAEWAHDHPAADIQHRHTSHLLGVFPLGQITPEQEELAKAAAKSIQQKLTPEENWEDTGWARALLILYEARLQHPDKAYRHIGRMLDKLLEPNGMIFHPPTRGAGSFDNVYELDGNTGLTAGIAEMLLQSHQGYLHILPCCPGEWREGRVTGLRTRGNRCLDISWNEQAVRIRIKALTGGTFQVRYQERYREISLLENEETDLIFWNI